MRFTAGVIVGILLVIIAVAAYFATGSFNTAATQSPGALEKLIAGYAVERSADRRAPNMKNPYSTTPEVLKAGIVHYKENCVGCHGAPGVKPGELAAGLNPPAPDLADPGFAKSSDGEIFWVVSNGIRMSGMAAFSRTHSDDEIWKIVAFVRHLPQLSADEQQYLREGQEPDEHHHEAEQSGEHAHETAWSRPEEHHH